MAVSLYAIAEAETKIPSRTPFSFVDDDEADKRYSCDDLLSVRECEQLVRKSISFRDSSIDLLDSIFKVYRGR
jgi:hypothetical protein